LLRTFVLAQNLPYPAFAGMDLRNWQNIHGLAKISEVGVFGLLSDGLRGRQPPPLSLAFCRTSADPALSYPLPERKLQARAWLLQPLGHPSDLFYSEHAAGEIDDLLEAFKPDLVLLEGLWLHRYIPIVKRRRCRLILDLHAVETAMSREMASFATGDDLKARVWRDVLPERVKQIERYAATTADQVWVCSERDGDLLRELHAPCAPVHTVPNAVDAGRYTGVQAEVAFRRKSGSSNRKILLYPAVFHWEPNAAAAEFLIDEVFPALTRAFPDSRLLLAGASPTRSMAAAAERDARIVVTGAVADMLPFFAAADAVAVPLTRGGGTRLKILEALAATVPVISTRKGAEGLAVEDGTQVLLAEDAAQFVEAIARVWTEPELAERLRANGLALLKRSYSWEVSSLRIARAIAELDLGACARREAQ
jgi:glycosyltransferase involved in cell wall biosynthesis